jgi:phosphohistidine phosphatase
MKLLFLMRHAKSSWKNSNELYDWERPLNKRGHRDAPFMADKLLGFEQLPQLLVSSSAIRARSTAAYVADALLYRQNRIKIDPAIYEASAEELLSITQRLDNSFERIMLFGHNMTYTTFVNWFARPAIDNFPTAGIAVISFDTDHWQNISLSNGKLIYFDIPKNYFPKTKLL